jgi:hypothetical protein
MARYLGRNWKKAELLSYIGDPAQVAGARVYEYSEGKAQGVRGVEVNTGSGFSFTVLPGRGMDIPEAYFRGVPIHMASGTGIAHPAYYEEPGLGWLRSFYVGLLTTCGITNAGAPSVDMGEPFGIHGRVSNAAAENLCVDQRWEGDEYVITLKGKVREAKFFFENMSLTRTIETSLGRKGFRLHDLIENHGFEPQPLLMLYHFNYGFPLLGPGAKVVGPILKSEPRDEEARKGKGVEECTVFPEPIAGYKEKVFFHTLAAGADGKSFVALVNRNIGNGVPLGIVERINVRELPILTQWKNPRKGFYVMGLEPGNCTPLGRGKLRELGKLPTLEGQARQEVTVEFEVLDSVEEIEKIENETQRLLKK